MEARPPEDRLPQDLLAALASAGNVRSYRAQTIPVQEGDPGGSLFIVLTGQLCVYLAASDGREVVLSTLGPGEYVGELSMDGQARSASVRALEATTCRVVQAAELHAFLTSHPDFAVHLSAKLVRMVRRLTEQVKSLALQDVYARLVRFLMEESEPGEGGERVVRQRFTQQQIADRIGSSREMVNRLFKELQTGGYATLRDRRYVLLRKLPAGR